MTAGDGSGSSWDNATTDLQGAINAPGAEKVFVAVGNYDVPSPHSFVMRDEVEIYCGFDPDNSITGLTHNRIMPVTGGQGSVLNGKNERPIIWNSGNGVTNAAKLDGFTLTNATGSGTQGAIYNNNTSPTLSNLLITNNAVSGIYNTNDASPELTNVAITLNTGAGFSVSGGSPMLTNVTVATLVLGAA